MNTEKLYNEFNKRIRSLDSWVGLKWCGKYGCEISIITVNPGFDDIFFGMQLYSDYGFGPRVYVPKKDIEKFISGEPLADGSYLIGKGVKELQDLLLGNPCVDIKIGNRNRGIIVGSEEQAIKYAELFKLMGFEAEASTNPDPAYKPTDISFEDVVKALFTVN